MTAPPGDRVNILVVDDRPAKLIAMEALLGDLEENVICVSSGVDALRQLLEREFALVLLDVNMPEMDGFETATLIRQRPRLRHIPIIFMTAGSDETRALQGYSLGAVDYILTPVVPEVLRTKVKVFVDLFRMAAELRRGADERVALAAERAARATAEEARRRAAFLAEAGKRMTGSLDLQSAIAALLDVVVPEIADAATLRLEVAGERIIVSLPVREPDALADVMDAAARDLVTRTLDDVPGRALACPVPTRGATSSVLGLAFDPERPPVDASTITLVEDLCSRAAVAIENCLLYREIQDRDARKDQFVAMLAHELRNPLGVISSALGILESLGGDAEPAEIARRSVRRQLQSLTRLIDDLVDVARITTGKITMMQAPVNLRESAQRFLEALVGPGKIPEHRIELEGQDTWVLADSVRIDQILTNLVGNARKYTPPGGRIRIRVEQDGDEGVVEVEDSGAGMAPDVLAHAFDLFFQGDRSADRADGGLGIGLTLVRQLVELHGGSIQARSPGEGRGSRFTIRLPGCAPPVSDNAKRAARLTAKARRILIVEDNEDARVMLKALLELAGHEVHDAADGPSALALVAAVDPEIAFIDIGLPGIDGYELARRLREQHKETCLVALSGYGQSEDRRKAMEAGFDMHLLKPVDPDRLSAIIASLPPRDLGELANGRRGLT